jgi:hypothetical protein
MKNKKSYARGGPIKKRGGGMMKKKSYARGGPIKKKTMKMAKGGSAKKK